MPFKISSDSKYENIFKDGSFCDDNYQSIHANTNKYEWKTKFHALPCKVVKIYAFSYLQQGSNFVLLNSFSLI